MIRQLKNKLFAGHERPVRRLAGVVAVGMLLTCVSCGSARTAVTTDTVPPLTEEEQRRFDYYYLEAVSQQELGNYDISFDLLQHCLAICPTASSALSELSTYYSYLGDKVKAVEMMELAVKYDADNFWYQENLAGAYYNNQDYDKAIDIYAVMAKKFPSRADELLSTLASLYQKTEQYDKVIEVLDAMEERYGRTEELEMEKFRIYWQTDDKEAAFSTMAALCDNHPDDTRYRLMLGDVCLAYNRNEEAQRAYLDVLSMEPDNDLARLGLANWYEKQGHEDVARDMVDSLVVYGHLADERRVSLMSQLIRQHEAKGDTLAISQLFDRVLAQPQPSIALPELIASYYIKAEKPDSVVDPVLNSILAVEPDNVDALKQLLYMAVQANDTERVRQRSQALLAYYPDELYAYYYLTVTALRDEDEAKAIDYCREGIRHIGDDSDTELCTALYSALGDLCMQRDERAQAYAAYDSALVYNPTEVSVLNNYAYYLSLEGRDLDHAEEMSRITINREPSNSTYLDTYAWILFLKERYEEARRYIDEALKNDTTASSVLTEHAGDIYYRSGMAVEALDFWKKALELMQVDRQPGVKPTEEERLAENKLKKKIKLKKWIP